MKTSWKLSGLCAAAIALAAIPAQAQMKFSELPESVQQTVVLEAGATPLQSIREIEGQNGATAYQIVYERGGEPVTVQISSDGQLLNGAQAAAGAPQGEDSQPGEDSQSRGPSAEPSRTPTTQNSGLARTGGSSGQSTGAGDARQIDLNQAPSALLERIRSESPNGQVQSVQAEEVQVYEISFEKSGKPTVLQVTEKGAVVTAQPLNKSSSKENFTHDLENPATVDFDVLPVPVKDTLKNQAGEALISDIQRGELTGMALYQTSFLKDGKRVKLRITSDGTLAGMRTMDAETLIDQHASKDVEWSAVPKSVRTAVQDQLGEAKVSKANVRPMTVYTVSVLDNGQLNEVVFVGEGKLEQQTRPQPAPPTQAARTAQPAEVRNTQVQREDYSIDESGRVISSSQSSQQTAIREGSSSAGAASREYILPLRDAEEMKFEQLPVPVQTAVRARVDIQTVQHVRKGQWNGEDVYQLLVFANGERGSLQLDADGQPIRPAAGAAPNSNEAEPAQPQPADDAQSQPESDRN